jgi:hypothetical protein
LAVAAASAAPTRSRCGSARSRRRRRHCAAAPTRGSPPRRRASAHSRVRPTRKWRPAPTVVRRHNEPRRTLPARWESKCGANSPGASRPSGRGAAQRRDDRCSESEQPTPHRPKLESSRRPSACERAMSASRPRAGNRPGSKADVGSIDAPVAPPRAVLRRRDRPVVGAAHPRAIDGCYSRSRTSGDQHFARRAV